MPIKLAKNDRRFLLIAGAVLIILITWMGHYISQSEEESPVPSSYSARSKGAKAAFLLLQEAGYNAERWEKPPKELPSDSTSTVLILADPSDFPEKEEVDALQMFLSKGGKIIATGPDVSFILPEVKTIPDPLPSPDWKEYQPQQLTSLTRAGAIQMSPAAYWQSPTIRHLVHYADGNKPVVVSYKVGRGEVIWWGSSIPLSNGAIGKAGNLALLLHSVGDDKEVRVLWDEYFHGYRESASFWGEWPIFYSLLQCGLVFLAMVFTYSRRNGPIRAWNQPTRLSPLEFVATLGNLYRRARHVQSAVDVPYARFRFLTIRQLGLKADISAIDLARAIKNRMGYKDPGLEETLEKIEASRNGPELSEAEALALVQQLSRHAYNLKFISQEEQEIASHADSVPGTRARPD